MRPAGKVAQAVEAPLMRCEYLCSGPESRARELAQRYGIEASDVEHRKAHALIEERRRLPGGSIDLASRVRDTRQAIGDAEARVNGLAMRGWTADSPAVREAAAYLAARRADLAALEQEIAGLPPEAVQDPRQAVIDAEAELAALRPAGNREVITSKAREIAALRTRHAAAMADRARIQAAIHKAAAAGRKALGGGLLQAFELLRRRLATLLNDPALEHAPEMLDRRAVEAIAREAAELESAFLAICPEYTFPPRRELCVGSPVALFETVTEALGCATQRRVWNVAS